ncbi:MAG TPA: hypothetical protein VGC90_04135, partial [Candidatus Limnocylindrales bacterium]
MMPAGGTEESPHAARRWPGALRDRTRAGGSRGAQLATRGVIAALLAVLVATGIAVAPPLAQDVRAATPDLTLVGDAQYDVDPANKAVHVTVDLLATNHLHDTATR